MAGPAGDGCFAAPPRYGEGSDPALLPTEALLECGGGSAVPAAFPGTGRGLCIAPCGAIPAAIPPGFDP